MSRKNKIIVILGPTSSGKTKLAVKLAQKYNGEIVSADSRQVYKSMDIGTGKDFSEYVIKENVPKKTRSSHQPASRLPQDDSGSIPYHMIDIVSPRTEFNLAKYLRLANKAIEDILKRGKLPIIVGGTGLYLEALVEDFDLSQARPDKKLRDDMEKLSKEELLKKLEKIDKEFAHGLNNSDRNNKRRLIRYIEVKSQKSKVKSQNDNSILKNYEYLILGLKIPRRELDRRIYKRLIYRLEKQGMVEEVKSLHKQGVGWKRLESFGLEYRFVSEYLQKKLDYDEMVERLNIAIRQFAKRQMTWFRRWEKKRKIVWIRNYSEANRLINKFFK